MSMSRRSFLQFCGGATAGAVLSPLPWKLLDDAAIWTQNWSWIPDTAHGPVSYSYTTCSQCSAGCGLRLRLVGGAPVSAWGTAGHPLNNGRLCPVGLGTAQGPHHPSRLRGAAIRTGQGPADWRLVDTDHAIAQTGSRLADLVARGRSDAVAILDMRPGRALSTQYARFLAAAGGGHYLIPPSGPRQAASLFGRLTGTDAPALQAPGWETARVRTILCCGNTSPTGISPEALLIMAAPNGSRATSQAHRWLPIRPGTETALVLGLTHILRFEAPRGARRELPGESDDHPFWAGFQALVRTHDPARTAAVTGIDVAELRATAALLAGNGPAAVLGAAPGDCCPLGAEEELAIWALNRQLGCLDAGGALTMHPAAPTLFAHEAAPAPLDLNQVPDGSLELLLMDGLRPETVLPVALLARKMRGPESLVVAMSPFSAGPARAANLVLPTAAAGEWLDDVTTPPMAGAASYALAAAFVAAPPWARHPAQLLADLAEAAGLPGGGLGRTAHEETIKRRVQALAARSGGCVFRPGEEGSTAVATELGSERLLDILRRGGCWTEAGRPATGLDFAAVTSTDLSGHLDLAGAAGGRLAPHGKDAPDEGYPLALVVEGQPVAAAGCALPPVLNKLYRESNLIRSAGTLSLNPATARRLGLRSGRPVHLQTPHGSARMNLVLDEAVQPGVVSLAAGPCPEDLGDLVFAPAITTICGADRHPVWRVCPAALREV